MLTRSSHNHTDHDGALAGDARVALEHFQENAPPTRRRNPVSVRKRDQAKTRGRAGRASVSLRRGSEAPLPIGHHLPLDPIVGLF
jgi:hypothetical protein